MKNYNTFCQFHSELLAKWYPKWIACIRKNVPQDWNISNAEIDSEITAQCMYLSTIFKGGSYPAFCNAYVEKRVLNILYKEYKMLDHTSLDDAYAEFEDNYRDSYNEKHQLVYMDHVSKDNDIRLSKDYCDKKLTQLHRAATKVDYDTNGKYRLVELVDLLEMNMHYEDIANRLGTTKMSVSRRVRKLVELVKNEIKETENETC